MRKLILVLCVMVTLAVGICPFASATSFTHRAEPGGITSQALSRELYTASQVITAGTLGLEEPLEGITDIYCASDNSVYILLGDTSKIIVLNPDYTLKASISVKEENGEEVNYSGSQGVFVDDKGDIYISDTSNGRILITDPVGLVKSVLELPQSKLIPQDFHYQPTRFIKDKEGYLYILSLGCYYGILTYSPENEFMGFFGANRVNATALSTLSYIFDLITSNDVKKASSVKTLPYAFVDLSLSPDGYLIGCSGKTETSRNGVGQIRKISPNGSNILMKRNKDGTVSSGDRVNFLERKVFSRYGDSRVQNFVAVDVSTDGFIFTLEQVYGLIYVYDSNCNLLGGFGGGVGYGTEAGTFVNPSTLSLQGNSLLVADAKNSSVTVFEQTEFGAMVFKAQTLTLNGETAQAKPLWEKVLLLDSGCQLACSGLAMALYNEKDYSGALRYAQTGLDYATYDLAYQALFKNFVTRNFIWLFLAAVLVITAMVVLLVRLGKRKTALIQNLKINTLATIIPHPFRAFGDLKYKNTGSLIIAAVLVVLFYFGSALQATATGFLFREQSARTYNTLYTLAQTVGLVLLWSLINWLMCTLFSGKGKIKEVLIASAYALLPIIIYTFVHVAASHFLSHDGAAFMEGLKTVVLIYTFFLLSVGMMTVHEYTFPKFLLTGLVTIVCMILAVFIGFMFVVLLQQFWNFIYSIYMEAAYR